MLECRGVLKAQRLRNMKEFQSAKKGLLLTFWSIFFCLPSWSFSAKTIEGVEMQFRVISEDAMTCEVYYRFSNWSGQEEPAISTTTGGHVTIPANVTYEYNSAQGVKTKTYIVTRIGVAAFKNCSELTGVSIPNTITSIGGSAFKGCSKLTKATIPNSVKTIGTDVFNGCESLCTIWLPDGMRRIEKGMFSDCHSLANYEIPSTVTYIGDYAFSHCKNLEGIRLSNVLDTIGANAFGGCEALETVALPQSLRFLGSSAFYQCTNLKEIIIPDSVQEIGESAFYECKSLRSILLPASLGAIQPSTFSGCSSLEEIKIPDSVKHIDRDAFRWCAKLHDVYMGRAVEEIKKYAFESCTLLTGLHIPDIEAWCKIKIESEHPFSSSYYSSSSGDRHLYLGDEEITNLVIPASIDSLSFYPFAYCNSVKYVTIPPTVKYIIGNTLDGLEGVCIDDLSAWCKTEFAQGANPLKYAHRLYVNGKEVENLEIPSDVSVISNYAFTQLPVKTIKIPDGVTKIGDFAFYCSGNYRQLEAVDLPNTLTDIGSNAFNGHRMSSISIPCSVKSIGSRAFASYNCLETVKSYIMEPFAIEKNVFEDIHIVGDFTRATLYVPQGTIDKYRATSGWSYFDLPYAQTQSGRRIVEMEDEKEPVEITEGETVLWEERLDFSVWNVLITTDISTNLFQGLQAGDFVYFYIEPLSTDAEYTVYPNLAPSVTPDSNVDGVVSFKMKDAEFAKLCMEKGFTVYGKGFVLNKIAVIRPNESMGIASRTISTRNETKAVFDLSGHKQPSSAKGLVIVKGKKYIKK